MMQQTSLRFKNRLGGAVCAILFCGFMAAPALAQESSQALPLGGLVPAKSADGAISVDSADIAINPDNVVAKYRFTNEGAAPANIVLTFPMPDLDFSDPDVSYAIPGSDPLNFVGLTTKISGKPGGFAFAQSAILNGKDITAELRQRKLSLVPVGAFQNQLAALPEAQRGKLVDAGIIVQNGNDVKGNALYFPTWTVRTTASKLVEFPPAQPVEVEIRYRTSIGMSLDTPLRMPLRSNKELSGQVQQLRAAYCIDDGFYAGLDKIGAPPPPPVPMAPMPGDMQPLSNAPAVRSPQPEANSLKLRERHMIFALKGRSSPGIIKNFRLVIDKGRPDRVVSFCLDNLKRISPTAFEMRASNFTAANDLKVLLIGRN